ncbi:hypothetical protein NB640_02230 [Oxalobacter vibrioformis]|uniref:Uncharacterized protein n=1 Tax=Oxalobacter vibrioformis TaxID=933080 RepID=A0A9E9P307_9BURK|nr:hypothetical protein [Oxalobacter vibrioformis]WAW10497.1 hypothetical protein NB640_02230 [Oxalobacter vibrioformis]
MKVEKLIQYALYFFLIGIGIIIGIAIRHYYNIPMSDTINIIDVAALITTIFLAVYIPEVLDRKLKIQRDKKKLIDSRIDELQYLYRKINHNVQQGEGQVSISRELRNMIDICESRLTTLIMLIEHAEMKVSLGKEIAEVVQLCEAHRQLFSKAEKREPSFLGEEERLYNEIDRATSLIILKLSDA